MKKTPLNKDEITQQAEYYTFYLELTNTGNSIVNATGVFRVKLLSKDILGYGKWSIGDGFCGSKTIRSNIANMLNRCYPTNGVECKFYLTKEGAIEAYNNQIDLFTFEADTIRQKQLKQKKKIVVLI